MSALLALLKDKKQSMAAGRRGATKKPPAGRSSWRIYPSWRGEGQQFWHDFAQHFIKSSTGTLLAIYVDTEKTFGVPSPINAAISEAIASCTDDATMQALKDAKASACVLVNAQQTDGANPEEFVILELRPTVFEQIITTAQDYEEAEDSIFDPMKGHEIVINREGTGLNTKYSVSVAAKNKVQGKPGWEAKLHNLDEYVKQESTEGAHKALTAIKSIAGLLPMPGAGGAALAGIPTAGRLSGPAAAAAVQVADEDPYAAAPAPVKRTPAPAPAAAPAAPEFEDVPPFDPTPAPAAAPRAAAPAGTGDDDLDNLLASLG